MIIWTFSHEQKCSLGNIPQNKPKYGFNLQTVSELVLVLTGDSVAHFKKNGSFIFLDFQF